MKVPCVIYCGLTQMTDADGGFRQEEQGTHLDKILHNSSTIQMDLALFQGPINLWWKGLIGPRLVSVVFDFTNFRTILFVQSLCFVFKISVAPSHWTVTDIVLIINIGAIFSKIWFLYDTIMVADNWYH
jgi:hypothetical protein